LQFHIIFKSHFNRRTNPYLISESTIGLEPMAKDGLYIRSLGKLGLYTDPYQYFGMLGNEMHRAVRLVVDTECIVKDGPENKPLNFQWKMRPKAAITTEIERYGHSWTGFIV
jgi:hypothetical protein